jgi:hypothetical protein
MRARELIALDDALNALANMDARKARVIELRFFGGLSVEETAGALRVSADTVLQDWRLARAWLSAQLGASDGEEEQRKSGASPTYQTSGALNFASLPMAYRLRRFRWA